MRAGSGIIGTFYFSEPTVTASKSCLFPNPADPLQVFGVQPGAPGDARQHARADFFVVWKANTISGQPSRARVRWDPD